MVEANDGNQSKWPENGAAAWVFSLASANTKKRKRSIGQGPLLKKARAGLFKSHTTSKVGMAAKSASYCRKRRSDTHAWRSEHWPIVRSSEMKRQRKEKGKKKQRTEEDEVLADA